MGILIKTQYDVIRPSLFHDSSPVHTPRNMDVSSRWGIPFGVPLKKHYLNLRSILGHLVYGNCHITSILVKFVHLFLQAV